MSKSIAFAAVALSLVSASALAQAPVGGGAVGLGQRIANGAFNFGWRVTNGAMNIANNASGGQVGYAQAVTNGAFANARNNMNGGYSYAYGARAGWQPAPRFVGYGPNGEALFERPGYYLPNGAWVPPMPVPPPPGVN